MKIKPINCKGTINQNVCMFRYRPIEISLIDFYIFFLKMLQYKIKINIVIKTTVFLCV
jgi:hypothetical protein